ncbi:D-alanine aminotransferase [Pirellulimonas nuda]|uniref:branched-chain-amino-acid transaminase n=1 Tax=Pirellulimonas nuda TaxID=2528009 RepID=A0A518DER6_9BACT|nr:aminotransferase class IV [Pirellulimonas nuda]QDU89969.1 D-alanine aminotransferase [Pirellulimonas nuda]
MPRYAYLNGQWIDDARLSIPVGDPGFALGVTVTERLRTFAGRPYRADEHLARLAGSLEIIGLPAEPLAGELRPVIDQYMTRNAALLAPGDDWAIVAFVTPGVGGEPTRCVHGFPLPFMGWASQFTAGLPLWLSDHRQTPANCWPPALKCRSRMHYYLADRQAGRQETGARAVLLDQDGHIGEASTANIVAVRSGEGIVSPVMAKVLPGVSVGVVRELASRLGTPFVERDMLPEDLATADEVWLCSTSVCMLPATRFNGGPIGDGRPGPVYQRFLAAWGESVGVDIAAQASRFASRQT